LLEVGSLLGAVLKKEKLAKNVLSSEMLTKFKDLQQLLVDIAILYLASNFDITEEFTKILLALGLLEATSSSDCKMDPLESSLFQPDFPKISLAHYYTVLRENVEVHDLMVGAISLKMLADTSISEYRIVVQAAINDSLISDAKAILNEDDIELIRT